MPARPRSTRLGANEMPASLIAFVSVSSSASASCRNVRMPAATSAAAIFGPMPSIRARSSGGGRRHVVALRGLRDVPPGDQPVGQCQECRLVAVGEQLCLLGPGHEARREADAGGVDRGRERRRSAARAAGTSGCRRRPARRRSSGRCPRSGPDRRRRVCDASADRGLDRDRPAGESSCLRRQRSIASSSAIIADRRVVVEFARVDVDTASSSSSRTHRSSKSSVIEPVSHVSIQAAGMAAG